MDSNEKMKKLLAESYFQAANSGCDMHRITDILEAIRSMFLNKMEFQKIDDQLLVYLGESIENDAEFSTIHQLQKKLRQNVRLGTKKEITEKLKTNENEGWKKWLEVFAHELARLNHDFLNSLLKIKTPPSCGTDFKFIKKHLSYLREERWVEGNFLFEFFLKQDHIPPQVKADLHLLAGAVQMYHLLDFDKAVEHFQQVKELIPGTSKAERIWGEYYIQQNDFKKAREHLQKALEIDKKDFENYLVLGDLYKAEKRDDTAANWYNEGLGENPGKADLYNRLLLLNEQPAYFKKHHEEVDYLLSKIMKLAPDFSYTALNNAAFVYQKNGHFAEAEEYYQKSIKLHPLRIQAWCNLGYAWLEKNEPEKSEEAFKKSIEIDKKAFEGYWGLVALNRKKENWNGVVANLKYCEKYRPQWRHYIYNDFGNAYQKLEEVENAQKYYLLALKHDREKSLGLNALYDIAEFKLPVKKGISLLEKIREIKGPAFESSFHHEAGVIYFKNQLYQDAIGHFEKAVETDPNEPVKLEYLGLAWEKTGNYDNAISYYRKAIKNEAADKSKYYNRLAFLLIDLKEYDEAIDLLQKAVEINASPLYFENLGFAYENSGNKEQAKLSYIKALELADNDKDIYENRLGIFYYNQGFYEKALQHYLNAIHFFPKPVYYENTGLVFERKDQTKKAEESYRNALNLADERSDASRDKYYNRLAFFLSGTGKHEEAVDLLKTAVQLNPAPIYYENLGYAFENLGMLEEAKNSYSAALRLSSGEKDIFLNRLGIFYYNQKKYEEAVAYYRQAIEKNPKAVYFENLGNVFNDLGKMEQFEEAYLQAAQLEPWEGRYYFQLGWNILDNYKDTQKAKKYLTKAIDIYKRTPEIEPEELMSIQFLGAAYQQEGNWHKAEEIFREAFRIDPENDIVCSFLGKIYLHQNDIPKALDFYEKAYHLNRNRVNNYINLGEALEKNGNNEKAIEIYKEGATLDPVLFEKIANVYYKNQEFDKAEENIRRAIEAYPENNIYHETLALTLQNQGRYDEARDTFDIAMKKASPGEADIYFNFIGNTWYAQGNFETAAGYYQKAIELNPYLAVYLDNLVSAYKLCNQKEKAIGFLEKMLEKEAPSKSLLNHLGLLLFETGKQEDAVECFKKYIELDPEDSLGYDNLGFALEKLNRREEAIQIYLKKAASDKTFYQKAANVSFDLNDYSAADEYLKKARETNTSEDDTSSESNHFIQGPA
ncbi:tetratricopeptide repeat protein [Mariniphaga sediminis]|uniref:Tetratricopeptide repeat protein n=2 Tax=Mariniphaga sediminis TaxID=1628158 RepID=A0A399CYA6_9BACT|nr:tetratricopeptide repeat protein [Mariniphaga sediminis]